MGGISRLLSKKVTFVPVAYYEEKTESGFRYVVRFGEPAVCEFELPEPENDTLPLPLTVEQKQDVEHFVDELMSKIAALLPEERRGVYGGS